MKPLLSLTAAFCLWSWASLASEVSPPLSNVITFSDDEHISLIAKNLARNLYLETSTIKQVGGNTFNGCDVANIDKHRQIKDQLIPVTQYKGIPIIGSPYYPVWVKVNENNNKIYLDRFVGALKVIETDTPDLFSKLRRLMSEKGGYFIVGNFCPKNGGLTLGAFAPLPTRNQFVVMVSSTLLLMDDLFNTYDIAATLVHEAIGHGFAYYEKGSLSEFPAFTAQADFAARVGDHQFKDINNKSSNIRYKMKLILSNAGHYLDKPDN